MEIEIRTELVNDGTWTSFDTFKDLEEYEMDYHEQIFIITDGCMWEINKQTGNEHPHAVEVVDAKTGSVRYIKSGSRISLIEGDITDVRSQKAYEKETNKKMPSNRQDLQQRKKSQTNSTTTE